MNAEQRAESPLAALLVASGIGAALAMGLGTTAVAHAVPQDSDSTSTVQATRGEAGGRSVATRAARVNNKSRPAASVSGKKPAFAAHPADTAVGDIPDIPDIPSTAPAPAASAAPVGVTSPIGFLPRPASPAAAAHLVGAPQPAVAVAAPATPLTVSGALDALAQRLWNNAISAEASLSMVLQAIRRDGAVRRSAASVRTPVAAATTTSATSTVVIESDRMVVSPSGSGRIVSDRNASGGTALALTGPATVSLTQAVPVSTTGLVIRAKTSGGAPNMTVAIDGTAVTTLMVTPTGWTDFTFAGAISAGSHLVTISTTTATTSNALYLDKMSLLSGSIGDEFTGKSGSTPNDALWGVRSGSGFDAGIQTYAASNALQDGQGHLVIQAVKTKRGGYSSGWVWSKNDVSYGYGTITARIKMPKGQGLWPAMWLMGADSDTIGWPASGEVDVVEMPSTTTTVYSTLHGPIAGTSDTQQAQIISSLPDLSADYHNYWVTHLENQITFGVDDQTLGTLTPQSLSPGESWVYNRPMYLILNLAVGGPWAGAPDSSTQFPAKMIVDSVRWDAPA